MQRTIVVLAALLALAVGQTVVQPTNLQLTISGSKKLAEKLTYPKPLTSVPEVITEDTLTIKFSLADSQTNELVSPHQVFVRFFTTKEEEVIYVAHVSNDVYQVSLTPSSESEVFRRLTGEYSVEIIVGDISIKPLRWTLGKVHLQFPELGEAPKPGLYDPLPYFKHVFRSEDARASTSTAVLFSLVILSPTLILLLLWFSIGVNVSNFPPSAAGLAAIVFHISIAAIFGLIAWYWLELTIFEFLTYLTPVSIIAIFSGSATLSQIAKDRK